MPVTIVVEDGSQPPDANSYVDVEGLQTYAANRGITLPASDLGVFLIQSADVLESRWEEYKGVRSSVTQAMQWPRDKVWLFDADTCDSTQMFPNSAIPVNLQNAQCAYACAAALGTDLTPISTGKFIKSEKLDVFDTVYSESINTEGLPIIPVAEAFIEPLLKDSGYTLTVVRA